MARLALGVVEHQQQTVVLHRRGGQRVARAVGQVVGEVRGPVARVVTPHQLQLELIGRLHGVRLRQHAEQRLQIHPVKPFVVKRRIGIEEVVVRRLGQNLAGMFFPDEPCAPVLQTFACQFLRRSAVRQQGDEVHKALLGDVAVIHQGSVGKVETLPVVGEQVGFASFRLRQGSGNFGKWKL